MLADLLTKCLGYVSKSLQELLTSGHWSVLGKLRVRHLFGKATNSSADPSKDDGTFACNPVSVSNFIARVLSYSPQLSDLLVDEPDDFSSRPASALRAISSLPVSGFCSMNVSEALHELVKEGFVVCDSGVPMKEPSHADPDDAPEHPMDDDHPAEAPVPPADEDEPPAEDSRPNDNGEDKEKEDDEDKEKEDDAPKTAEVKGPGTPDLFPGYEAWTALSVTVDAKSEVHFVSSNRAKNVHVDFRHHKITRYPNLEEEIYSTRTVVTRQIGGDRLHPEEG
jgi:hypothetical protein